MQRFHAYAGEKRRESRNRLAILAPLLVATASLLRPGVALLPTPPMAFDQHGIGALPATWWSPA